MANETSTLKLANLLFEISSLRKIARTHRAVLLTDDLADNIATHSFLVSWAACLIAKKEKNVNMEKILQMAMLHDAIETRTGDIGWINKRYTKIFEQEAIDEMFGEINDFTTLLEEYNDRKTIEAKIVKDADKIAQLISLKEYVFAYNNQQAKEWLNGVTPEYFDSYFTETGKDLAQKVIHIKVNDWAKGLRTDKGR
ncbi:HD domain-containing protein [Patescibacteria group bacterium]|nr:HD domain-containing protein [Patescibacteria group bacterium]